MATIVPTINPQMARPVKIPPMTHEVLRTLGPLTKARNLEEPDEASDVEDEAVDGKMGLGREDTAR
jgi:hypothetical protein